MPDPNHITIHVLTMMTTKYVEQCQRNQKCEAALLQLRSDIEDCVESTDDTALSTDLKKWVSQLDKLIG